jgi:hypothetical protein
MYEERLVENSWKTIRTFYQVRIFKWIVWEEMWCGNIGYNILLIANIKEDDMIKQFIEYGTNTWRMNKQVHIQNEKSFEYLSYSQTNTNLQKTLEMRLESNRSFKWITHANKHLVINKLHTSFQSNVLYLY